MSMPLTKKLITVEEYARMGEAGIYTEDDRVELIEGEVLTMAAVGKRHMACVKRLARIFSRLPEEDLIFSVQDPIRMNDLSDPQPDLALLRFREDYYEGRNLTASDTLLIVEVSDSTLTFDREVKLPLYARAGIPEAWIVDLNTDTVWVFSQPEEGECRSIQTYRRGDTVASATLPDLGLRMEEILG